MLPPKANSGAGIPELLNWTGEEDSRIVPYVEGVVRVEQYQRVVLLSNDTDSFALLVHYAQYLQTMWVKDIWQCSVWHWRKAAHASTTSGSFSMWSTVRQDSDSGTYGQGSQKLYNWQNIVSPPHYRNDVHHPHDIICLYCRGLQDESEYIYFYIVYVSHLSSIDEYCRTFGSNTVILACLQTNIAHSNLLHKKSINCNQTI